MQECRMTIYLVKSNGRKVGMVSTNPDGFVIIDADDLRAYFGELKDLWDSPVTVTPYKSILRIRLDLPFKDRSDLDDHIRALLKKNGYDMESAE